MRRVACIALLGAFLALAGCGPAVRFAPDDGVHVVQRGETLYSIATAYDMDWKDVARRNGIRAPYTIHVGQRLRIVAGAPQTSAPAPSSRPRSDDNDRDDAPSGAPVGNIAWIWPADGRVVSTFRNGEVTRKGIDIAGELGQPVRASAPGEVVYSGSGLAGYGKLIILKHDARFLSAYAYNQDLLVSEGQRVQSGQVIARMGQAEVGKPLLHFEIRLDGTPIDPMRQLPRNPR